MLRPLALRRPGTILFLLACCIPVLAYLVDHDWLSDQIGAPDTWFYLGYFRHLGRFAEQGDRLQTEAHQLYYQTRFPYSVPGWLLYHVFADRVARALFAALVFCTAVGCGLYSFRRILGIEIASLAVGLMCCDIFFLRSVGWTYVDNGVLAYQSLALACLVRASAGSRRTTFVALAAFCFASSLLIHLGSAVLGLFLLAVALGVLGLGRCLRDYLAALGGVIVALIVWGLFNVAVWHGSLFFILQQVAVGQREMAKQNQFNGWGLEILLRDGHWIAIELGVWLAGGLLLAFRAVGRVRLPREQTIVLAATVATFTLLVAGHLAANSLFFLTFGFYTAFFLPMTYASLAILVCRGKALRLRAVAAMVGIMLVSLLWRLHGGGDAPAWLERFPAWAGVLSIAGVLAACAVSSRRVALAGVLALAVVSLSLSWRFASDAGIDRAYDLISTLTGPRLPRIAMDLRDEAMPPDYVSIIASFTDKAWWNREAEFPKINDESFGQPVFVLSRHASSEQELWAYLAPYYDRMRLLEYAKLVDKQGPFWVYEVALDAAVHVPDWRTGMQPERSAIPAAKLDSLTGSVDGTSRVARARADGGGYLTFGPYAVAAAGRYVARIRYSAEGDQAFDIQDPDHGDMPFAKGLLRSTGGSPAVLEIPFDLAADEPALEVRTMFSGRGSLKVDSIGIVPVDVRLTRGGERY